MQSEAAGLARRLLGALDDQYNVIDMPSVVEIISLLEEVVITKELLETTRLGKHVNELRRKLPNDQLSKRAKGLLKKWRSMVLPDTNGQAKTSPPLRQTTVKSDVNVNATTTTSNAFVLSATSSPQISPTLGSSNQSADVNLNEVKTSEVRVNKKRAASDNLENINVKRPRPNGVGDFDFSDNSNSSFKDLKREQVIVINSDSNSSITDKNEVVLERTTPKKRGRKKGSKNHKNLLDEAESSFSNKLAVSASRGNSKVKTTQELLASIQNKNSILKPKEDLIEKAAKLTQRVSIIDQKLNTNATRNKNSKKVSGSVKNERVIESGSVINFKNFKNDVKSEDEEIIVVDDIEGEENSVKDEITDNSNIKSEENLVSRSLTIEEALSLLPPVDTSILYEDTDEPSCSCFLKENKPDFSIEEEEEDINTPPFEFIEDSNCPARIHLENKYQTNKITDEIIERLHSENIPNVNGTYSLGSDKPEPEMSENGLYSNVVPNIYEKLDRFSTREPSENFQKYCHSNEESRTENAENSVFREWYECADKASYKGENLRMLPYVVID